MVFQMFSYKCFVAFYDSNVAFPIRSILHHSLVSDYISVMFKSCVDDFATVSSSSMKNGLRHDRSQEKSAGRQWCRDLPIRSWCGEAVTNRGTSVSPGLVEDGALRFDSFLARRRS